jgi:uncharacterized protein YqcC (DUF446 family)
VSSESSTRQRLGALADQIQGELERLGLWQADPPSEDAVLAGGAFGMESVAFEAWIQVVFVRRLRSVADGSLSVPSSSSVAVYAVREWDGATDRDHLLDLLTQVDDAVN